ncbi:MAG: TIGR00153 family protein [Gammaproteobacteria bacterium RIFCSPHIGHO2_02_FULL_42_13]|nr:MAG: TIGR00153 family protein [Gammaproteobacteria bacterium RIFCSPHIGHO2_02_FULL_42_13]OGT70740.1 MAG: TIGR00153 family protein [Gammaproteobacteria bacterium RIFCSPLOWO2_02_FULL_42_9]
MAPISILKMFRRSPIDALQNHMTTVHNCVKQLMPFFGAVLVADWEKATEIRKEIARLEDEADDMKRMLRLHLPTSIFMPVSRTDVLELLSRQDLLANKAKDIAGLVIGRRLQLPQSMHEAFLKLLGQAIHASAQALKTNKELNEVFKSGFSGKEISVIEGMADQLLKIERETDLLQIDVRDELFALEKTLPPVDVVFLYQSIEWIGDLGNHAQHVGDRLQMLIAR